MLEKSIAHIEAHECVRQESQKALSHQEKEPFGAASHLPNTEVMAELSLESLAHQVAELILEEVAQLDTGAARVSVLTEAATLGALDEALD